VLRLGVAKSIRHLAIVAVAYTSTTSDPQLGADGHVPIISGRSGAIQTWLGKQRAAGRASDSPGTTSRCRTQPHGSFVNSDASIM